jgi:hypothetical protein
MRDLLNHSLFEGLLLLSIPCVAQKSFTPEWSKGIVWYKFFWNVLTTVILQMTLKTKTRMELIHLTQPHHFRPIRDERLVPAATLLTAK